MDKDLTKARERIYNRYDKSGSREKNIPVSEFYRDELIKAEKENKEIDERYQKLTFLGHFEKCTNCKVDYIQISKDEITELEAEIKEYKDGIQLLRSQMESYVKKIDILEAENQELNARCKYLYARLVNEQRNSIQISKVEGIIHDVDKSFHDVLIQRFISKLLKRIREGE